ncbi:MAG: FkbM family methyltransferase [Bacteroidota bacterium]
MKTLVKYVLQKILGFRNYLYIFALYIIATLKNNRKEGDFLYFLSLLPDHSTVLDIGANIGVMTVHMARKLPNSDICSFEPVPDNLNTLKRLLLYYKLHNVRVFEMALGNFDGTAEIILPEHKHVKFQGLSHIEGVEGTEGDNGIRYTVPMHKLDTIPGLMSLTKPISGIKLDVENYEFQVLEGALQLLTKYKPLIYAELWDNQNRADCLEFLKGIGYSSSVLENGVLVKFDANKHKTQNFFFQIAPETEG